MAQAAPATRASWFTADEPRQRAGASWHQACVATAIMRARILALTVILVVVCGCASNDPFRIGAGCGACMTLLSAGFCYGCCTADADVFAPQPTRPEPPAPALAGSAQAY
ncbi:MAG: hypothetical protein A2138_20710 [Deltaproteobacteria bacterium RBG_16_71_12]|nr:MAG: hypothetical protein A2138_20710 [Deltaproteobacteria bacterium RBG_16_71_12]